MSTKHQNQRFEIEKKELIKGLSLALDLAEQKYMSHAQHIAYLSVSIGRRLGMDGPQLDLLYYAALIHDIGAGNRYDLISHCEHGAEMARSLPVESDMAVIIHYHHEFFDGSGPFGLKGNAIPLLSQIIHLANQFDYEFQSHLFSGSLETGRVLNWLKTQENLFAPEIIEALTSLMMTDNLLEVYFYEPFSQVLAGAIEPETQWYDLKAVKQFAYVFSQMIDKRSTFTHQHSTGLTAIVGRMCQRLGYDAMTQDKMYIAALLHDIGKLGIDRAILEKQGKLTPEERYEIEKHSRWSYDILSAIKGFDEIAVWAGQHHEKLNGAGYPEGITGDALSEQARLIAICDIYQALTEDRPYRSGMGNAQAFHLLQTMVDAGGLDPQLLEILISEFSAEKDPSLKAAHGHMKVDRSIVQ